MIIPAEYAQVNLIFSGTGVPRGAQLTFGVDNTTNVDAPSTIAAAVGTLWDSTLKGVTLDVVTLAQVLVKAGPNDTGPFATLSPNITGSQSSTAESPQVALVVDKLTALGGRENRGRWFLPGVRESYVDGSGNVDPSGGGAIQTQLTAFLAGLVTNDYPMVVLHNRAGATPTPVTALILTTKAGTQRRRLRKVGGRRRTD